MDRKIILTEKSSSDVEAIVRYISRRDPSAAARIGLGIYDRAQIETRSFPNSLAVTLAALPSMSPAPRPPFFFNTPRPEQFLTSFAGAVGESSSSDAGKSSIRSVKTPSLSVESGQRRWVKLIWKRRSDLFRL